MNSSIIKCFLNIMLSSGQICSLCEHVHTERLRESICNSAGKSTNKQQLQKKDIRTCMSQSSRLQLKSGATPRHTADTAAPES